MTKRARRLTSIFVSATALVAWIALLTMIVGCGMHVTLWPPEMNVAIGRAEASSCAQYDRTEHPDGMIREVFTDCPIAQGDHVSEGLARALGGTASDATEAAGTVLRLIVPSGATLGP